MSVIKTQFIQMIVLAGLLVSCAGGGLGMLLHSQMDMSAQGDHAMDASSAYSCCATIVGAASEQSESTMVHNTTNSILTTNVIYSLFLVFIILFFLRNPSSTRTRQDIFSDYVSSIRDRFGNFVHFYRHIIRLFSQGIIHSHIW
ncbi:MAG: hypothetical protein HN726_01315 [Candidatus Magasanikbacteria bacterium]|jgi:hypothetical protein|nr:hypothetical protein [Candidatus Magasanikbacteria bacterium]MBT4221144.1 hypothetical protein [Candidatus Magasanikbacteria bacterium]MBT4350286.1 hypothetical protein [Candidatus Magasanikbacteria bacterium]MBT4541712.1 hypothetical protein [Candidatus Magasanikbacteria bacterium]MBT6253311.1 hypothetical protein [Candidatus Magasanikbacteria bacterium]